MDILIVVLAVLCWAVERGKQLIGLALLATMGNAWAGGYGVVLFFGAWGLANYLWTEHWSP